MCLKKFRLREKQTLQAEDDERKRLRELILNPDDPVTYLMSIDYHLKKIALLLKEQFPEAYEKCEK